jgi:NodT family efflux transporter outer membrane factor (OMF) lipoprotein
MCISARNKRRSPVRFLAAASALALSLGACEVGPDFVAPAAPESKQYTPDRDPVATAAADGTAQQFETDAVVPSDWWHLFDCKTLDDAVRQGLAGSPTIAVAEANLRQARDDLRAGEGVFYPQVNAGFGASREHPSPDATPQKLSEGAFNLFTLSATVSYTFDVFGGERRAVEALAATVDYQQNTARAAALTLASNIANTMIAAAAYDAEITATEETIEIERQQVRLGRVQADAGTLAYAGVLSLQTQLEATEATLPPLRQKLAQAQDLLAVLVGKLPAEWHDPQIRFADLELPHDLPVSLPSALVRQRPDILQAEASLHEASAGIGVATAAMLPSITLTGSSVGTPSQLGTSATSASALFGAGSKLWSVGTDITQPIFHGGTLWFQRKAAVDAFDASAASYRQVVLSAFQQVADTLRALEHDADALAIEDRALQTASRALELTRANYRAGIATYAEVLIADAQFQQTRIADIQARAIRYQDTVALFVALGGGWWSERSAAASPD